MKLSATIAFAVATSLSAMGQDAATLYQTHCATCHGDKFQGGAAQSLADGIWQFGAGAGYIIQNIKYGIPHLGMPSYEKTLTDPQIKALAGFLLEAEKTAGAVKPPIPTTLQTLDYNIAVAIWADGLEVPWSIAFLDEKTALVTERPGRLRVIENGHLYSKPVEGTPKVVAEGQGGLLAVAFDPDYKEEGNQWIYLAFSHGLDPEPNGQRAGAMTKLVRGRINGNVWTNEQVVFEAPHDTYRSTRHHYGTRIVFDAKKNLYFSIGERGTAADAQDLSKPNGKIHRIRRDGSIPKDNPFLHIRAAMPSIYSYGHRNPQGIAIHPETGQIWSSEHGPLGGDELNLIRPGLNYGWPIITYGKNYNGTTITDLVRNEGMEQPVWYWRPSTAVSAINFYHGDLFPKWNNKLLVGALKYEDLRVLDIEKDRVMHEEVILKNAGRVRDVACGPDGAIYVVLNDPGTILRLTPKKD
ncbi:MAG: PQQ-dependent sugar dehydrogenase [Kiritimatiellales bacterium]|nr:PQQ-dependent sugar dehydrogenase [Kiritimatiellales bacterium]